MKILINQFEIFLFSFFFTNVFTIFLKPKIFENRPIPKIICEETYLAYERNLLSTKPFSYIECVNEAIIKIEKATLQPSNSLVCPLQFANFSRPFNCMYGVNQWDVTIFLKELCNNKHSCEFLFNELPPLRCECYDEEENTEKFDQPRYFQYLNVTYTCQGNRIRFRPFTNRRHNPKFRATLFHSNRKLSYNHLRLV